MIVPAHWAEARVHERRPDRQITVRRFGWSDASEADAKRMAEARAREAFERIARGEGLERTEPKVPYNGAEGVPIREEIVRVSGRTVVTRNSYGALCINTPDVLFADVDFADRPHAGLVLALTLGLMALSAYLGERLLGPRGIGVGALVGLGAGVPLVRALWRIALRLRGGVEAVAQRRVAAWVARNPRWLVNLYRTPNGLRLLALHDVFDPSGPEALALFRAVRSDPIYVRMCARQRCFRARVSPKPWRIGIAKHMRPRPGVWPIDPARLPDRKRWIERYEQAAKGYAACRFVATLGDGTEDRRAAEVCRLHDALGRCREDLPIA